MALFLVHFVIKLYLLLDETPGSWEESEEAPEDDAIDSEKQEETLPEDIPVAAVPGIHRDFWP